MRLKNKMVYNALKRIENEGGRMKKTDLDKEFDKFVYKFFEWNNGQAEWERYQRENDLVDKSNEVENDIQI